jgi:DNA-binding NarL/FixJ family response regulator
MNLSLWVKAIVLTSISCFYFYPLPLFAQSQFPGGVTIPPNAPGKVEQTIPQPIPVPTPGVPESTTSPILPVTPSTPAPETNIPSGEKFFVREIKVEGNTVLQKEINALKRKLEGKEISFEELLELRSQITQLYIDNDYISSGAFILNHQFLINDTVTIQVVDDQELVLFATVNVLEKHYPEAEIFYCQKIKDVVNKVANQKFELVVVDLAMPENAGDNPRTEAGIQLLKALMQQYPTLNIVVQSAYPRSLVRLKPAISNHEGGFTVADKSLSMNEMLAKVDWALKGINYTPKDMRSGLEIKPEWLKVLQLAFNESLQDTAIATKMSVAERTVRHYWTKIYDVLGVYPDEGKNLRIQTEIRAREEGLID